MSSTWVTSVNRVEDGKTTFSANGLNPIIDALVNRTDYLNEQLTIIGGSRGYIMPDIGFSSACSVGMLVAYDPASGTYVPAKAAWSSVVRTDGSYVPASTSFVVGVLISKNTDGSGNVLCNGWTEDQNIIDTLAPGKLSGNYYLSATNAGYAEINTTAPQELSVFCYTYIGHSNGTGRLYIYPRSPEYGGHSHAYVDVTTSWVVTSSISGWNVPGAVCATDVTETQAIMKLLGANPTGKTLVRNGAEVKHTSWGVTVVNSRTYIWLAYQATAGDVYCLHAIIPFTTREPLVHTVDVLDKCKLLQTTNSDGNVLVATNIANIRDDSDNMTGRAVVELTDNSLKTGPIVQKLLAGPGMTIENYADENNTVEGAFVLSADSVKKTLIDIAPCNVNGVLLGSASNKASYTFPKGIKSSITGTARVPYHSNPQQRGKVVIVAKGNGGSAVFSADVTVQKIPTATEPAAVSTASCYNIPSAAIANTSCYYIIEQELAATQYLLGNSYVTITLSSDKPSTAIEVLSISIQLV